MDFENEYLIRNAKDDLELTHLSFFHLSRYLEVRHNKKQLPKASDSCQVRTTWGYVPDRVTPRTESQPLSRWADVEISESNKIG